MGIQWNVQERDPAKEERMARWNARDKLPNSSWEEFHIPFPSERPDRKLLLLSIIRHTED